MIEFVEFPKMARLRREIIITEKIDGTNASIDIRAGFVDSDCIAAWFDSDVGSDMVMRAGSRTKWVTPNKDGGQTDNFGFAAWAVANAEELKKLGPGTHFGEWWGQGIQRKYDQDRKRFSLFNVTRWNDARPACCDVVPTIYRGPFEEPAMLAAIAVLQKLGSQAAPGFMKPEGIVVYHTAGNVGFKQTIEKDEVPKSKA